MTYHIDIQRDIDISERVADGEDPLLVDTLAIGVGPKLAEAFTTFQLICGTTLYVKPNDGSAVTYIRLRLETGGTSVVVSRRTPSGQGDW